MKYFFPLAIVILTLLSCNGLQQKTDCTNLKSGNFLIKGKRGGSDFSIVRTDTLQYETNRLTGITSVQKVSWIGPCEYKLIDVAKDVDTIVTSGPKASFEREIRTISTIVNIISVAKDFYVFEVKKEGINLILSDTMWKVDPTAVQ